ncbi:predicted kinase related to galactokinase and mevalonate kinase [Lentimicrobium saccharophilum]|uniref:Predicted kinase related to galactokinase and mevalonate kinase n=1 Tax=Lentimicrobium saccharophilum TaxID=1678841 RepID=A0A0S7C5E7_9BACT|nr:dehydrogenase [Lentimicrobium saccharophilum]GAP44361.1 predicted kinase related to galactokinase and mevalonate kinase [Lentimicrobium saccharophilum]
MIIRSKAPLRLGLAGGGTDVAPYSDIYGGAILNATISMYAYATIIPRSDGKIILNSIDKAETYEFDARKRLSISGTLDLHRGIYNSIIKNFIGKPLSFSLSTYVDAPPGSGLGTSSTLVVAIIGAFAEWLKLPLGEYDLAKLAYDIERVDLLMAGGKQDQYAATFGGVNFMEFSANDKVIVNPLRIKDVYLNELAHNLVLFYTQTSRLSSKIIEAQSRNVVNNNQSSIDAMHQLKLQSVMMKEALLRGDLDKIGEILDFGWKFKKQMADEISNPFIDQLYETARENGATGGKISGAGGGGFMIFYCPGETRSKVISALKKFGVEAKRYEFTGAGLTTWTI